MTSWGAAGEGPEVGSGRVHQARYVTAGCRLVEFYPGQMLLTQLYFLQRPVLIPILTFEECTRAVAQGRVAELQLSNEILFSVPDMMLLTVCLLGIVVGPALAAGFCGGNPRGSCCAGITTPCFKNLNNR